MILRAFIEDGRKVKLLKENRLPYERNGVYILARAGNKEYHIAKIIGDSETSNPDSVGNASTRCLRYYKSHEYSIAEKEPARDEVCRACQSKRYNPRMPCA